MKYFVKVNGRDHQVEVVERLGELVVSVDGKVLDLSYEEVDDLGQVVVLRDGKSYALSIEGEPTRVQVTLAGHFHDIHLEDERERAAHAADRAHSKGGGVVTAIMPGVVVEVLVQPGGRVAKGAPLLILSAMKMQNEIGSPVDGVVKELYVAPGQAVAAGAKLLALTADP
ncbi:MAG: acetyl-CoA carboxylase biotin carboxyl carrier protein subunit [Planctomycetes bacterium]|nr:acetyl-CoA carboxylase biotin carboxyl carrier protein subunit [Planctomycetota bacterium]